VPRVPAQAVEERESGSDLGRLVAPGPEVFAPRAENVWWIEERRVPALGQQRQTARHVFPGCEYAIAPNAVSGATIEESLAKDTSLTGDLRLGHD